MSLESARTVRSRKISIREGAIVGMDVGEDFLDLAILHRARTTLSYHRVPLQGLRSPVAVSLAARIADVSPLLHRGATAFVDSPRVPLDANCAGAKMLPRTDVPTGRLIDSTLRHVLRCFSNDTMRPLSMFPTPRAAYFARCILSRDCKPHLRVIGEELLGSMIDLRRGSSAPPIRGGVLFTRFMLVGFAAFLALEAIGIHAFECYPDLQFRLWSGGREVPSKRLRSEALRIRTLICARLARTVGLARFESPVTLDQADAAVVALSAAASATSNSLIEIRCAPEGRFAVAFPARPFALDKSRMHGVQR